MREGLGKREKERVDARERKREKKGVVICQRECVFSRIHLSTHTRAHPHTRTHAAAAFECLAKDTFEKENDWYRAILCRSTMMPILYHIYVFSVHLILKLSELFCKRNKLVEGAFTKQPYYTCSVDHSGLSKYISSLNCRPFLQNYVSFAKES